MLRYYPCALLLPSSRASRRPTRVARLSSFRLCLAQASGGKRELPRSMRNARRRGDASNTRDVFARSSRISAAKLGGESALLRHANESLISTACAVVHFGAPGRISVGHRWRRVSHRNSHSVPKRDSLRADLRSLLTSVESGRDLNDRSQDSHLYRDT